MGTRGRWIPEAARDERGFTVFEVLLASVMIGLGLVAAAYGLTVGVQGVETGRQQSTAVYLAEQRLDQVRAAAQRATEPPLGYVTAANFPSEAYGSISGASKFRRTVTITSFTGPAGGLPTGQQGVRVDVNVFYKQITAGGVPSGERSVRVSTFMSAR